MNYYIMNEAQEAVAPRSFFQWAMWMETADRTIARDQIEDLSISTVFLGIEDLDGHLFETMIFGPKDKIELLVKLSYEDVTSIFAKLLNDVDFQIRYMTAVEAKKGHAEAISLVKRTLAEMN